MQALDKGIVSHDLKEPLNSIISGIQLIKFQLKEKLDEQGNKLIDLISNSATRMTKRITDLLDFSNIGQVKEMTMVDCGKLVDIVQQDLATKIKETNTTIVVRELPKVKGLETELRLLFQNLISNAIKFIKRGIAPKIIITARKQDVWTFSIQDNGIEIADEHMDKIFNVFQRLHSKSEYDGTGIGLAHCKKIIDLHKSELWVNSKLGEGSTLCFTIPNQL